MPDLIADASLWLTSQLVAHSGTECEYRRGEYASRVTATIGRSEFQSQTQSGMMESWESRDYMIATSALPYGQPIRGDVIVQEINGAETLFEVAAPAGVPVFHFGDAAQTMVRVHTKQTDRDITFIVTEAGEPIAVPLEPVDGSEIVVPITAQV